MVLVVESLNKGIDFTAYMLMEWLLTFLTKGTKEPTELRNVYEQKAAMLLILTLSYVQGTWLTMSERLPLPTTVVEKVPPSWLPSDRTYQSWQQVYDVGKFFQVRIVRLDTLYEERSSSTERYSGYTKGYGNGGHRSSTLKTPYSSELDGETTDREPAEIPLMELDTYNDLLLQIEKAKISRTTSK
jgi:hypothetical protein